MKTKYVLIGVLVALTTVFLLIYFVWFRPYSGWSTDRLIQQLKSMETSDARAVAGMVTIDCDEMCAELVTRQNCGTGTESCLCYLPTACMLLNEDNADFLDGYEETCTTCDIANGQAAACSDRYLDRNVTDSNCDGTTYTRVDCLAACDEYKTLDPCITNDFCKINWTFCLPCTIDNTTSCSDEALNAVLLTCYSNGMGGRCNDIDIQTACAALKARNNSTYTECANTTCLSQSSDAYYATTGCTPTDIKAALPATCDNLTIPCLDLCTRLHDTDSPVTIVDPGSDLEGVLRSSACTVPGCSEFVTRAGWECCTSTQLDKCTKFELETAIFANCQGVDLGMFEYSTAETTPNGFYELKGEIATFKSYFDGQTNSYTLLLSINGGSAVAHPLTFLLMQFELSTFYIGNFPITTDSVPSATYQLWLLKNATTPPLNPPPWKVTSNVAVTGLRYDATSQALNYLRTQVNSSILERIVVFVAVKDQVNSNLCILAGTRNMVSNDVVLPGIVFLTSFRLGLGNILYYVLDVGMEPYCTIESPNLYCSKLSPPLVVF